MKIGDLIELVVDLPPRFRAGIRATIIEPRDNSFDPKYPHIPPSWYAKMNGEEFYFYEDEAKVIERSEGER